MSNQNKIGLSAQSLESAAKVLSLKLEEHEVRFHLTGYSQAIGLIRKADLSETMESSERATTIRKVVTSREVIELSKEARKALADSKFAESYRIVLKAHSVARSLESLFKTCDKVNVPAPTVNAAKPTKPTKTAKQAA